MLAIDFGTSRTKVAYYDAARGRVSLAHLGSGDQVALPSLFYVGNDGNVFCGSEALDFLDSDPRGTVRRVKSRLRERAIRVNGQAMPPADLVTKLFTSLRARAGDEIPAFAGKPPTTVILTLPAAGAGSGPVVESIMRTAAAAAGFTDVQLMTEPEGAARAWQHEEGGGADDVVVILDSGGGTADWACLKRVDGTLRLYPDCPPGGDDKVGGEYLDEDLFGLLVSKLEDRQAGEALRTVQSESNKWFSRLRALRERFNRTGKLGAQDALRVLGEAVSLDDEEVRSAISERFLNQICDGFGRYLETVRRATGTASPRVLLVGGMGQVSGLKEALRDSCGCEPTWWQLSEVAPVIGAAWWGAQRAGLLPESGQPRVAGSAEAEKAAAQAVAGVRVEAERRAAANAAAEKAAVEKAAAEKAAAERAAAERAAEERAAAERAAAERAAAERAATERAMAEKAAAEKARAEKAAAEKFAAEKVAAEKAAEKVAAEQAMAERAAAERVAAEERTAAEKAAAERAAAERATAERAAAERAKAAAERDAVERAAAERAAAERDAEARRSAHAASPPGPRDAPGTTEQGLNVAAGAGGSHSQPLGEPPSFLPPRAAGPSRQLPDQRAGSMIEPPTPPDTEVTTTPRRWPMFALAAALLLGCGGLGATVSVFAGLTTFTGMGAALLGPAAASVTFDGEPTATVHTLDAVQLQRAIVLDAGGQPLDPQPTDMVWSATPDSVVALQLDNGLLTPVGNGEASVEVTVGEVKGSYKFVVALPDKIYINGYGPLAVGQTLPLTATVLAGADEVPGQSIIWVSENGKIASVDEMGVVTGLSRGVTNIQATTGALSTRVEVTITGTPHAAGASTGTAPTSAPARTGATSASAQPTATRTGIQVWGPSPNAKLVIDGREWGLIAPGDFVELSPGSHIVIVKRFGNDFERTVNLHEGETKVLDP